MKTRSSVLLAMTLGAGAEAQDFASEAARCQAGQQKSCATILKAARNKNSVKRLGATLVLTDPAVLAELARGDSSPAVRVAAIENPHLVDATLLAALAADADAGIRRAALARATDPEVLAKAARSDPSEPVRAAAIASPHLTDQAILASIVADSVVSFSIREAALGRLTDQAALLQLARTIEDRGPVNGIVERLSDPAALVEVATTAKPGTSLQYLAARKLEKLVGASSDKALLLTAARARGHAERVPALRSEAIKKLTDEESLTALAMEDLPAAPEALRRVEDPARIAAVAKGSASKDAAEEALRRVADEATLGDIARSATHTSTRVAAVKKMAKPPSTLWNEVLLRAVREKDWWRIESLASRSMALHPSAKAALQELAADATPFHASLTRALVAGVPSSSWGGVRLGHGISTTDLGTLAQVSHAWVPPGTYTVRVSYRGHQVESRSSVPLEVVVRAKTCYVIESNAQPSTLGGGTWRPGVRAETCPNR